MYIKLLIILMLLVSIGAAALGPASQQYRLSNTVSQSRLSSDQHIIISEKQLFSWFAQCACKGKTTPLYNFKTLCVGQNCEKVDVSPETSPLLAQILKSNSRFLKLPAGSIISLPSGFVVDVPKDSMVVMSIAGV